MKRMGPPLATAAACAALLVAGCGDDESAGTTGTIADATEATTATATTSSSTTAATTPTTSTTSATSTTSTVEDVDYAIDAQTFIFATNKKEILAAYVANEENTCSEVDDGFVFTLTAAATETAPETPLEELIFDACGEPDA